MIENHNIHRSLQYWRQQRGLSLQDLADRVGTTKSQIDKLEKAERRLTVDWLLKLAEGLEIPATDLLAPTFPTPDAESGSLQEPPPPASYPAASPFTLPWQELARTTSSLLPVMAKSDAVLGSIQLLDTASSFVPRPPSLAAIPSAFALYMPDDRYQPRYRAGDILYINPERPVTDGAWVLVCNAAREAFVQQFHRTALQGSSWHLVGLISGVEVA